MAKGQIKVTLTLRQANAAMAALSSALAAWGDGDTADIEDECGEADAQRALDKLFDAVNGKS
jgi:hypothetical protein